MLLTSVLLTIGVLTKISSCVEEVTEKMQDLSKYKHTVPIIFKNEFVCSGSMATNKLVVTSSSCLKKGPSSDYSILITDKPWRKENLGTFDNHSIVAVNKIMFENKAYGLGLVLLANKVPNAMLLTWDMTGKLQPWLRKETVLISGWEGQLESDDGNEADDYDDDDEEDDDDEYEDDEYDDDGEDEAERENEIGAETKGSEYQLAVYTAVAESPCQTTNNDPALICLTPQKSFFCKGFLGGPVITGGIKVAVITDVSKCNETIYARIMSLSKNWLRSRSAHLPNVEMEGMWGLKPSSGTYVWIPRNTTQRNGATPSTSVTQTFVLAVASLWFLISSLQ